MALFPAFAESCDASPGPAKGPPDLDWLSNKSFQTRDALSLHQMSLHTAGPADSPRSNDGSRGPQTTDSSAESGAERKRKKEKKKKRDKKKKKKKKKRKWNSDSDSDSSKSKKPESVSSRGDAPPLPTARSIWLDEGSETGEETFRIDKRADPANWEYKSLYRGDIARYKRRGHSCLGINPKKQQITWEGPPDKKPPRKRAERYYSKVAVRSLRSKAEPVPCGEGSTDPAVAGFIPVKDCDPDAASVPTSWVNPLGVYDASTSMWLQGKGGPENKPPVEMPRDTELLGKVEDYNRRIRENPEDIATWMEFVSFQDELIHQPNMYSTNEAEADGHRLSLRLVLEKKLSILERAIESNPASTALKLARLRLCAEFWESAALLKEWQKLIFLHPNDPEIWRKYLQFSQGQFSAFSVSKVNAVYGKCLSTLSAVQDGCMLSHPPMPGTERCIFDLFLQQCHFLRQAGHCEKSISLFQAMMDFTFYKPDSVKDMTTREQVDFFEPFWDSGEPRFGEKGAKGWSSWMRQQERGGWITINDLGEEDEEEGDEEIDIKDKSWPRHKIWLDMECSREARHWLPWRPDSAKKQTEEDCEDPDRQVLFDDLGHSMFKISSPELKFQFILSFLQFLGIPCGSPPFPNPTYSALDETSIFEHLPPYERILTSYDLPFSGVGVVGHLDTTNGRRQQIGQCKEGERFIQNVFQSALSFFHGEEKMKLSVFWLQYEILKVVRCLQTKKKKIKSQGKRSKRLAKGLLKEAFNRNSLALWKEYALLEWLLGNTEEARKVFDAAVGLGGSRGLKDPELCSLCLLYAQLEAELLQQQGGSGGTGLRPVHILASLAENSLNAPYSGPVQAITVLKARKTYERTLQGGLGISSGTALVSVTGCFALFQYLTMGIDAAMAVFRQVHDSLLTPTAPCEEPQGSHSPLQAVAVMQTNLLRYHIRVGVHPKAPLRDALMAALRLYPHNVALWRSYILLESGSHSASRTRRFIDGVRRTTGALEPYLFAIRAEEDRKRLLESALRADMGEVHYVMPETGLSNRIKALFEHALGTEQGARCLLLWRMYLHFMVSLGHRDKSRGLFYKAIQSCPWAKVLYMDAAEYFPEQLQEIVDLMTEKELRVRVPLEELEILLED